MAKQTTPNHVLIPKHEKLSKQEAEEVLKKYKVTVNELPAITKSDPAIAELGCEEGDIIAIERESPTAGKTIFYRGVING